MNDEYKYTVNEIAAKFDLSVSHIRKMAKRHKNITFKREETRKGGGKGGAKFLYRWSDWEEFHRMSMQARKS